MRLNYYKFPAETAPEVLKKNGCESDDRVLGGVSIMTAKKLLKQYGGTAWTEHCDRDGGCFKVTPITLIGNNSRFKYNHHLYWCVERIWCQTIYFVFFQMSI